MKKSQNGFTMIEMIFVIVVLGILAAIAVPKFAATRTDAEITKGRSDIASIRTAIITERQSRLIKGDSSYINKLHSSDTILFDGNSTAELLMYGIAAENKSGHWHTPTSSGNTAGSNVCTYKFKILEVDNLFTYTQADGKFLCTSGDYCSQLVD